MILQIGATFRSGGAAPVVLFCDSNIRLAQRARTTGHGEAAELPDEEVAAIAAREQTVYDSAAAIMTLSHMVGRSFAQDFGVREEKIHTIHAGPNLAAEVDPDALERARAERTGHRPTVLFVGRQFERKGGDLLLRSFRIVREAVPDAQLIIVGPEGVAGVGSADGVVCLGFLDPDDPVDRERLRSAYVEADVFCLPTRFEPFGIVFLEAMFHGLPCIGPDAWAIPEIIEDGETGFLSPSGDEAALAEKMVRLLRDPELARRMGGAGSRRARGYFTWPATIERMNAVLARVGAEHGLANPDSDSGAGAAQRPPA